MTTQYLPHHSLKVIMTFVCVFFFKKEKKKKTLGMGYKNRIEIGGF